MALSRHHAALTHPHSVEEITSLASEFEFSSNRPLKGWLRSAQMLLTEAAICEQEGKTQMAYLYLYRHAQLVLGKFPQHPEYADPKFKAELAQAQKTVQRNLEKLELWKPRIKGDYARYFKALERRKAERQRVVGERFDDRGQLREDGGLQRDSVDDQDGVLDDSAQALNVSDNRQLAVDLAHQEIRRRDVTRQSTRQAGISPTTVASRRRGFVLDDSTATHGHALDKVNEEIIKAGHQLQGRDPQSPNRRESRRLQKTSTSYRYPSVPVKEDVVDWKTKPLQPTQRNVLSKPPPSLPPKEAPDNRPPQQHIHAPPIPPKQADLTKSTGPTTTLPQPPAPSKYTFKPTASTESGAPLRTVLLPPDLRTTFLALAHANTTRNLETCGILCGTLISNALFISHLILPDQISTSDTCDTTESGDNDLFNYCSSHDLLVCGWIHTHPSQSCFLSSRDLHTSAGYQVMLPEAIAIVCAPSFREDWGVFRLTDPPGLKHVLECEQRGLFHPHAEERLYTDATRPGHVVEGPGLEFEVVDLRK